MSCWAIRFTAVSLLLRLGVRVSLSPAPASEARDKAFQDQLMDRLAALTGVKLF